MFADWRDNLAIAYLRHRRAVIAGAIAALVAAGGLALLLLDPLGGEEEQPAPAPAIVVREQQPAPTEDLGFPAFATKNTTRVAGLDPIADAAAAALAVFPSTGGVKGPIAVSLVAEDDWASGVAAASLMASPIRAPMLVSGPDEVPAFTADALDGLAPTGSQRTGGRQVFAIGAATAPDGLKVRRVSGGDPAELADEIDRLRQRLSGADPHHIVLTGAQDPAFAIPAAAWAARSGDPVLFASKHRVPEPTLAALRRHPGVPVYVLGPTSVISDQALDPVRKIATVVERVGAKDPVENAIAFARFSGGDFGWDINDPGHGFVIANADRPLDAGAAAPLSASGNWGPLLVTEEADTVPAAMRSYLLDVKPGYVDNPTRAVYNHIWLIGDQGAISVGFQAQVDDLAEVVPVRSGLGSQLGPAPGTPEHEQPKAQPDSPRSPRG